MLSDDQLIDRLRQILQGSDLETTTSASVRRRLEQEFGLDLRGRRVFIRDQIDLYLSSYAATEPGPQNDCVVGDEVPEEEEEEEGEKIDPEDRNDGSQEEEESDDADEEELKESDDEEPSKKKRSVNVVKDAKGKGGGFCKPCALSPQLQEFLGEPALARTEVVKRLWAYIREKDLQNPKNRRKILCDETLRGVFKVNTIDMFQMNKALSKHIWPLDDVEAAPIKSSQNARRRKDDGKEKRQSRGVSGFLAPLPISDALATFLGTGEIELSRADGIKRMWQYIKENELQDPSDKRRVICDDKLKELFNVDSFIGFTVSKLLSVHFIKAQG